MLELRLPHEEKKYVGSKTKFDLFTETTPEPQRTSQQAASPSSRQTTNSLCILFSVEEVGTGGEKGKEVSKKRTWKLFIPSMLGFEPVTVLAAQAPCCQDRATIWTIQ